jgi:hypothetical protein
MLTRILLISLTIIFAGVVSNALATEPDTSQKASAGKQQCLPEGAHCGSIKAGALTCCPGHLCMGGPRNMYCK